MLSRQKYMKEYWIKNKEKIYKKQKLWKENNKEKVMHYGRKGQCKWYKNNREKAVSSIKKWSNKNMDMIRGYRNKYRANFIKSWVGYIPQETNCEVCGKKIFFTGHKLNEVICFDHKHENCVIKCTPSAWLGSRLRTKENETIWESCNFGMLCYRCNHYLPTKNRKDWLKGVINYVNK